MTELQEDNLFETPEVKRRYSPSMYYPIFDPSTDGVHHQMFELARTGRYKEALRAIDEAKDISDEEREFFKLAAARFIEFNFTAIAEQYCVSSPAARELYEKLALVYVSTTQAISNALIECDNAFREYVDEANRHFANLANADASGNDESAKEVDTSVSGSNDGEK